MVGLEDPSPYDLDFFLDNLVNKLIYEEDFIIDATIQWISSDEASIDPS